MSSPRSPKSDNNSEDEFIFVDKPEIELLKDRVQELETLNASLEEKTTLLEKDNKDHTEKEAQRTNDLMRTLKDFENDRADYIVTQEKLLDESKNLHTTRSQLNNANKNCLALQDELEEIRFSKTSIETKLQQTQNELKQSQEREISISEQLKNTESKLDENFQTLQKQKDEAILDHDNNMTTIATLKDQLTDSSTKITGLEKEISSLKEQIKQFTEQHEKFSHLNKQLTDNTEILKNKYKSFTKEYRKLQIVSNEKEKKLSLKIKFLEDENTKLTTNVNEKQELLAATTKDMQHFKTLANSHKEQSTDNKKSKPDYIKDSLVGFPGIYHPPAIRYPFFNYGQTTPKPDDYFSKLKPRK